MATILAFTGRTVSGTTNLSAWNEGFGETWAARSSVNSGTPVVTTSGIRSGANADSTNYTVQPAGWNTAGAIAYGIRLRIDYVSQAGDAIIGPVIRSHGSSSTPQVDWILRKNEGLLRLRVNGANLATVNLNAPGAVTPHVTLADGSYIFEVEYGNGGATTVNARIQRLSDGFWLTSGNVWQATKVVAATGTSGSIAQTWLPGLWLNEPTPLTFLRDGEIYDFTAADVPLNPGPASPFSAAGYTPTLARSGSVSLNPGAAAPFALGAYPPTLARSGSVSLNPGSAAPFALSTYPPTLAQAGAPHTVVTGAEPMYSSAYCLLVPTAAIVGIVLYSHGQNEQYNSLATATGTALDTVNALTASGYMIASSNAGGNYGWGKPQAVNEQVALLKLLRANYPAIQTYVVMGSSMGGISGLNLLAKGGVTGGIGFIGLQPTYDLNAMHAGAYAGNIESAYGTVGQTWPHVAYGHDPAARDADQFGGMPILLIASAADTTVPKASHADVMASAQAKVARSVTVVAATGNHGDPSHFNASAILAFVQACYARPIPRGTPTTTKTVSATLYTDQAKTIPLASASVKWRWADEPDPAKPSRMTDSGTATTSAGGVLAITVRTNLTGAQLGRLDIATDDGTQASAWRAVSGPMTVA